MNVLNWTIKEEPVAQIPYNTLMLLTQTPPTSTTTGKNLFDVLMNQILVKVEDGVKKLLADEPFVSATKNWLKI